MPLVLAIEPDPRQASVLERVVKGQVRAELVLVDSKDAALAVLATRIPDVILVTALLPPRDEDEITAHLKTVPRAGHVQTLAIPLLADSDPPPSLGRRLFSLRRKSEKAATDACAPAMFAEQVQTYLQRAAENRQEEEQQPEPAAEVAVRAQREPADKPESRLVIDSAEPGPSEAMSEAADPDAFERIASMEMSSFEERLAGLAAMASAPQPASDTVAELVTDTALVVRSTVETAQEPQAEEPVPVVAEAAAPECDAETVDVMAAEPPFETVPQTDHVEQVDEAAAPETVVEQLAEQPSEEADDEAPPPAAEEKPYRWIWTGVAPLPSMTAFQMFLADSREDSLVRGYQLRRASAGGVVLIAEHSVVEEPVAVAEAAAEPAAGTEVDSSLWDKLFDALEERFEQEKARVASTEAAAAQQARKYAQARKAAKRRPRRPEPLPAPVAAGRKSASPLETLRSDIERLLRKTNSQPHAADPEGNGEPAENPGIEPREPVARAAARPVAARPAPPRRRDPQPAAHPIGEDEWGFYDPEQCGFAALLEKMDAAEAESRKRQDAASPESGGGKNKDEAARVAPLAVWAHAVSPDAAAAPPVISADPLGHPPMVDPSLRLPDDVVAVRYASGCRIGEVRVAERPPEPEEGDEKPVVLLSKKLLKKPR